VKLDPITDAAVNQLFRAPLGEFIAVRNDLSTRVKREDPAIAAWIKRLAKPSVSAWAVNQLYWEARDLYARLIAAGAALHAMTGGDAAGMRAAMAERRHALDEAVQCAERILEASGHGTSMATMRRVSLTLEALAAHGGSDEAVTAGRLSADVDPPALDRLALLASMAAVPASTTPADAEPAVTRAPPSLRIVPPPAATGASVEAERARAALTEAEGDLKVLAHEARRAEEARAAAAARLESLDARVEEARASLAQLEDKHAAAQRDARDARAAERRAAAAETRAQKRVERARAKLDEQ
jgi:hypothetical protein